MASSRLTKTVSGGGAPDPKPSPARVDASARASMSRFETTSSTSSGGSGRFDPIEYRTRAAASHRPKPSSTSSDMGRADPPDSPRQTVPDSPRSPSGSGKFEPRRPSSSSSDNAGGADGGGTPELHYSETRTINSAAGRSAIQRLQHHHHHRGSPASIGSGFALSESPAPSPASSHAYTDSDEVVAVPASTTPPPSSSSTQASVEVVRVQHADAVMMVGASPESDSQVREEMRLMNAVRDAQNEFGEVSMEVVAPLEELAALFEDSGNYERRRDVLSKLVRVKEVAGGCLVARGNRPLTCVCVGAGQALFGEDHPNVSDSLAELGQACLMLGDDARARETLESALRIDEREFGDHHPQLAKTLVLLGHTYARLGKVPEQRAMAERAVHVLGTRLGGVPLPGRARSCSQGVPFVDSVDGAPDEYPELTEALSLMSDAYQKNGDHERQRDACQRELTVMAKLHGAEHISLVPVLRMLASAYNSLGEFEREKAVLRRAISIQDADPAEKDSPKLIWTLSMLAWTYSELEEFPSARATLQRVLDIKRKRYGPMTSTVLQTVWELAAVADGLLISCACRRVSPADLRAQT